MIIALLIAAATPASVPPVALAGGPVGSDAAACRSGTGPAVRATIVGLKDRTGRLKLELYPATAADFLRDDFELEREGKTFRRVWAPTPPRGDVTMCIKVPRPGRYALLFTHDRDGQNKFDFWRDGAGFPGNVKLGRSRPKVEAATIDVGSGITNVTIRAQYLRGLSGFAPIGN